MIFVVDGKGCRLENFEAGGKVMASALGSMLGVFPFMIDESPTRPFSFLDVFTFHCCDCFPQFFRLVTIETISFTPRLALEKV